MRSTEKRTRIAHTILELEALYAPNLRDTFHQNMRQEKCSRGGLRMAPIFGNILVNQPALVKYYSKIDESAEQHDKSCLGYRGRCHDFADRNNGDHECKFVDNEALRFEMMKYKGSETVAFYPFVAKDVSG
jgi:hypothetical protein